MPRISRLDVEGYRGIRKSVPLLFESKSVLLFGENGTGKSSFVDALEKLLTGRVSTLDGRAQGLSSDRHGPHIRSGANPTRITVTFDDRQATLFAQDSKLGVLPEPIQRYINAARQNFYILRRRQVLDFIESQPRERYDLLRPFLALSNIETIENALHIAAERSERLLRESRDRANRVIAALARELDTKAGLTMTEDELTSEINKLLVEHGQPEIGGVAEIDKAVDRLDVALASFGDVSRQSDITLADRALAELIASLSRLKLVDLLGSFRELRQREMREARVFYEAVLEQGIRWIEEAESKECPLCEQSIDPSIVVAGARQRLEAMRDILDFRRKTKARLEQARQMVRTTRDEAERAMDAVRALAADDKGKASQLLDEAIRLIGQIDRVLAMGLQDLSTEDLERSISSLDLRRNVSSALRHELERLQQILSSLPSAQAAQRLLATRGRMLRIKELWNELGSMESRLSLQEQQHRIAERLYEYAKAARKQEVQELFDRLSRETERLYQAMHPDENLGGVQLSVRDVGQGSTNLRAGYYDREDEDPRAYYSDAHLDTLGLSIFLALRKWYREQMPTFDLLVLDDVLTSVDAHHVTRVSELLLREFKDYQILLTTHDRIWFEQLRDIQARCGVANNFVNKIIHKWTIDGGPDIREPFDERQAIDRLIADGSAQEIAGMGGRLLEHILQEMRYVLRLRVPAKAGEQYEIGDVWPAFYATMKRNYPTFYSRGQQVLDALDVGWPVRNWIGAHRNNWAQSVPRKNAIEFSEAVRDLFDLVYCDRCRRFISPSSTPLGQLACRCGQRIYSAPGQEPVAPKTREELVKETQGVLREAKLDTDLYLAWKREEAGRGH